MIYPPLPPEVMHDLQRMSEAEFVMKQKPAKRSPEPINAQLNLKSDRLTQPLRQTGVRNLQALAKEQ